MMLNSPGCSKSTVVAVARKILAEMQALSSNKQDSILRDTVEAVKRFSWETVRAEYILMIPTLMLLLESLVPKPAERQQLICFVASLLLKSRHQRMSLVQRAVSIMFYGNGSSKQVRVSMAWFFISCMCHKYSCTTISNHSMYACLIKQH